MIFLFDRILDKRGIIMDQEDINILKITRNFCKENIGWIIAVLGIIGGLFSASYSLYFTLENFLKSLYYNVDFSLYRISLNIYQIILILLLVFLCWEMIYSMKKSGGYLIHKFINKRKNKNIPTYNFILSGVFLSILFVFLFLGWKDSLYLFLIVVSNYFIISFFLFSFKYAGKAEKKSKEISFNLKEEIFRIIQVFAIILCIEIICCFISVTHKFYTKKDYSIIEEKEQIEVVVETYPDYYIMKKARIDDNNLIIIKDSQSIKSTFDTEVNKRSFNKIYFE